MKIEIVLTRILVIIIALAKAEELTWSLTSAARIILAIVLPLIKEITFAKNLTTMKKIIYTLSLLCFLAGNLVAQQCTNPGSGSTQCTPSNLSQPGLSPRTDSLPPFTNGVASTTVIQFKNFNTVLFSGFTLTVQSLRIDSIENLPSGLCWATDRANNTYSNQENGCIKVNGTPCAQPGQYKLRIWVFVNVGITSQLVNAESAGLRYFVRVGNDGDVVPVCDTLQTVPLNTTGYSPTAICGPQCPTLTFTQSTVGNTSCANPNGSLTVAAAGGQSPYSYSNGGNPNSTGVFTGLAGGNYTITATDANQCTGTVSVSVSSTTPTISITSSVNNPQAACSNPDGSLVVAASGGSSPYSYSNGGNPNSTGAFTALAAGNYTITATDANSCSATASFTIGDNTPNITVNTTSTPSHSGVSDGTAIATPSAGVSPFTYSWSPTGQTTQTATGLATGNYSVTVTDANGCSATGTVVVGFNGINTLGNDITDLKIFPNPTSDNLTVSANLVNAKPVTIEIFTLAGAKVLSRNVGSVGKLNETLNVRNLSKGSYLVSIKAGDKQASYSIEVQ